MGELKSLKTICLARPKEKLREAAKQRLRRMCAVHARRKELEVPQWVRDAWKSKPQAESAQLLMDANWDKDPCRTNFRLWPTLFNTHVFLYVQDAFIAKLEVIVRKKSSYTVWLDEEWLSEKEMKDDLKWSQILGTHMHKTSQNYTSYVQKSKSAIAF